MASSTHAGTRAMLLVVAGLFACPAAALAQERPAELALGLYSPSTVFPDSAARLAYVQGLARAIRQATGVPTTGRAFVRFEDLQRARVDFAILEAACVTRVQGTVLATAIVGGEIASAWGLYGRGGGSLAGLRGKRLAYARTGCRDSDFLDNVLFEGELKARSFFAAIVEKPDAAGAISAVRDYLAADAVFAPATQAPGLAKVFDGRPVPNAGFVTMNSGLPDVLLGRVREAVVAHRSGVGIDGWRDGQAPHAGLAARMDAEAKQAVLALPEPVRLDPGVVLLAPAGKFEEVAVGHHFLEPPVGPRGPGGGDRE